MLIFNILDLFHNFAYTKTDLKVLVGENAYICIVQNRAL